MRHVLPLLIAIRRHSDLEFRLMTARMTMRMKSLCKLLLHDDPGEDKESSVDLN